MNGNNHSYIAIGARIKVVRKKNRLCGTLTAGIVRDVLSIKLYLKGGTGGRGRDPG